MKELSRKNIYYISKDRYLELLHFVRQYPVWQKKKCEVELYGRTEKLGEMVRSGKIADPTEARAEARLYFQERMDIVDKAAEKTHEVLGKLIVRAIIEGRSYDTMLASTDICCGREMWYGLYREFFWHLDKARK